MQYETYVDIHSRNHRRKPEYELQTFYGRLEHIISFRLSTAAAVTALNLDAPTTIVFGVLLFGPSLAAFLGFVHTHFIHRSTLPNYLHSTKSYAVVTGASDGIGKALAVELVKRGFNLVIHGRNAVKLGGVKAELDRLGTGNDVRMWIADAGVDLSWESIPEELQGLEITVLVNNVGGAQVLTTK